MQLIGSFVAQKCHFDLAGYEPSAKATKVKDYLRETINYRLTRMFLKEYADTPIDHLDDAYEAYKSRLGLVSLKRYMYRDVSIQNS